MSARRPQSLEHPGTKREAGRSRKKKKKKKRKAVGQEALTPALSLRKAEGRGRKPGD